MKIDHPKRAEILDALAKRCRADKIPYYRIELILAPDKGWDARVDIAGGAERQQFD